MAASDLLVRIGADISSFQAAMDDVGRQLNRLGNQMAREASGWERFGARLTSFGTSLAAKLTAPLGAFAAAVGYAASQFDDALDVIRIGTGATGAALDDLGASMRRVMASIPADTANASVAISELNTRLGLTGPALEQMTTQMLELARLTGSEVKPLIESTTRMFGDWSVATDQQAGALDLLFRVSQTTGIGVTQLADLLVQFGAPLRQFGMNVEEAAALLGKWAKEGVNTELVLSGLRIGLAKFSGSGEALRAAIGEIERLMAAGKEAEAVSLGFEVFGKRAGVDMVRAIAEGRFAIQDLVATLRSSGETIMKAGEDTMSLGDRLAVLRNRVMLAAEPIGVALLEAANRLMPALQTVAGWIGSLTQAFAALPEPVQTSVIVVGALAAAIGPAVIALGQLSSAMGLVSPALTLLRAGIQALLPAFAPLVSAIQAAIAAIGALNLALGGIAVAAAAYAIYRLIDAFQALKSAQRDLQDANERVDQGVRALERRFVELGGDLVELRRKFEAGQLATRDWHAAINLAVRAMAEKQRAAAAAGTAVQQLTAGQQKAAQATDHLAALVKRSSAELREYERQQRIVAEYQWAEAARAQLAQYAADIEALRARERAAAVARAAEWDQFIPRISATRAEIQALGRGMAVVAEGAEQLAEASLSGLRQFAAQASALPPILQRMADEQLAQAAKVSQGAATLYSRAMEQVSTVVTDLGDRLVGVITRGERLGTVLTEGARSIRDAFMRLVIEEALRPLMKMLEDLASAAVRVLTDVIGGAIRGLLTGDWSFAKLREDIGRIIDTIRSLGDVAKSAADSVRGITSAVGGGAGAPGRAPSGGGGAGGAGGSAGAGGALGWISLATGIVDAIFSGITAFSQRRMEQDIARIEISTRASLGQLIALQQRADEYWPYLEIIANQLQRVIEIADAALNRLHDIAREAIEAVAVLNDIRAKPSVVVNVTATVSSAEQVADEVATRIVRALRAEGVIV